VCVASIRGQSDVRLAYEEEARFSSPCSLLMNKYYKSILSKKEEKEK